MDEAQQLENERQRGRWAAELLDNEIFKDIWTNFEQQIVEQLKASSPRDAEGREKAVLMLQILAKLKGMVEQSAASGQMAQIQLERKESRLRQAMGWIGRDGLTA